MEGYKPNLEKPKSKEGISPVSLTLKAAIAAGVIASASPAQAQDPAALHAERASHTMTIDAGALLKMADRLVKIAHDPKNGEIAKQAGQEIAPIAIDAAKKIAEPAINELINGLTEFRNANYPSQDAHDK